MKTDIEIARSIALEPIEKIAAKVAIPTATWSTTASTSPR